MAALTGGNLFDTFRSSFVRDPGPIGGPVVPEGVPSIAGLHELLGEFGGASFGQGLYRSIATDDLSAWRDRLALGFPAFRRAVPFGFDWLGRLFALDGHRLEDGEPGVTSSNRELAKSWRFRSIYSPSTTPN